MTALDDAVADAVFLAFEMEAKFAELFGGFAWDVDFVAGTFTFHTEPDTVLRSHFLGSAAPGPGTWMWGWHNVNGFPESSVAAAERVRAAFAGSGAAALEQATVPLSPQLPLLLTLASKAATGIFASVDVPSNGGTRVYLLLEHESLRLDPPTASRVVSVISDGIRVTDIASHRRAVESYARLRGIDLAATGSDGVELRLADGVISISFDALGRISSIRGQITPEQAGEGAPTSEPATEMPAGVTQEAAPDHGTEKPRRWWQRSRP